MKSCRSAVGSTAVKDNPPCNLPRPRSDMLLRLYQKLFFHGLCVYYRVQRSYGTSRCKTALCIHWSEEAAAASRRASLFFNRRAIALLQSSSAGAHQVLARWVALWSAALPAWQQEQAHRNGLCVMWRPLGTSRARGGRQSRLSPTRQRHALSPSCDSVPARDWWVVPRRSNWSPGRRLLGGGGTGRVRN